MEINKPSGELPKYVSHKEVWALKIKDIKGSQTGDAVLSFEEEGYADIPVTAEWCRKHDPTHSGMAWVGGYYVVYKDGYVSWSPAEAFEEGYTLIK